MKNHIARVIMSFTGVFLIDACSMQQQYKNERGQEPLETMALNASNGVNTSFQLLGDVPAPTIAEWTVATTCSEENFTEESGAAVSLSVDPRDCDPEPQISFVRLGIASNGMIHYLNGIGDENKIDGIRWKLVEASDSTSTNLKVELIVISQENDLIAEVNRGGCNLNGSVAVNTTGYCFDASVSVNGSLISVTFGELNPGLSDVMQVGVTDATASQIPGGIDIQTYDLADGTHDLTFDIFGSVDSLDRNCRVNVEVTINAPATYYALVGDEEPAIGASNECVDPSPSPSPFE